MITPAGNGLRILPLRFSAAFSWDQETDGREANGGSWRRTLLSTLRRESLGMVDTQSVTEEKAR